MERARFLAVMTRICSNAMVLPVLVPAAFAFKLPLRGRAALTLSQREFATAISVWKSLPVTTQFGILPTYSARSHSERISRLSFAASMSTASAEEGSKATDNFDKNGRIQRSFTLPPIPGVPLQHHTDRYNSAVVEDEILNSSSTTREEFKQLLEESVTKWKAANVRAVWLRIATEASELIPEAVAQGFSPHHAAPDHVTLTAWFGNGNTRLPGGPSHFVGVAGFVLDRVTCANGSVTDKVLVIQEKSGPTAGIGLWKLPGGLVDPKEDIATAAEREVREETGVEADFQRLCSILENHNVRGPGREGTTDLFCLCFLRPRHSGARITKQEEEISECRWMDVEELKSMPMFQAGVLRRMLDTGLAVAEEEERRGGEGGGGRGQGFTREEVEMVWRNGTSSILVPPRAEGQDQA